MVYDTEEPRGRQANPIPNPNLASNLGTDLNPHREPKRKPLCQPDVLSMPALRLMLGLSATPSLHHSLVLAVLVTTPSLATV